VSVDVVEERDGNGMSPGFSIRRRQRQKRNPCDGRKDDDSPANELKRGTGQTGAPQRLIQRSADNH
jgi:hypothetical protein